MCVHRVLDRKIFKKGAICCLENFRDRREKVINLAFFRKMLKNVLFSNENLFNVSINYCNHRKKTQASKGVALLCTDRALCFGKMLLP